MSDLYRDFIDQKADQIITDLGGTITPAPPNELYRDFLGRKFDDVINSLAGLLNIKSFTYTGNGGGTKVLDIPDDCHLILSIYGTNVSYSSYNCSRTGNIILVDGVTGIIDGRLGNTASDNGASINCRYTYDAGTKKLSMTSGTSLYNNNWTGANYTVYYI